MADEGENTRSDSDGPEEIVLQDSRGRFYKIPTEQLKKFEMSDEEVEKFLASFAQQPAAMPQPMQAPMMPQGMMQPMPPTAFARVSPTAFARPTPTAFARPTPTAFARPTPTAFARPTPTAFARPTPTAFARPTPMAGNPYIVSSWIRRR